MLKNLKLIAFLLLFCTFSINVYCTGFCFTASSGPGYRLMTLKDSASSSYESYFKQRKKGLNINLEAVWYNENSGIGIGFNSFLNSASGKGVVLSPVEKADISDQLRINYFSFQYHNRMQFNNSRFWGDFGIGLGLVRYRDEGKTFETKSITKGKTYGLNANFSCSYAILKNLHIMISAGIFSAVLSEWETDGIFETLDPKEGLTRVDLNSGIKLLF